MTEKTILQQIRSLAQASVNTDDDQEQFSNLMRIIELTETDSKNFAVGEYYVYNITIFKVLVNADRYLKTLELTAGKLREDGFYKSGRRYTESVPATAEQIATFKRAEQFAKHGRKLDEFRVGDVVRDEYDGTYKVTAINNGALYYCPDDIVGMSKECKLITTAEELQGVGE